MNAANLDFREAVEGLVSVVQSHDWTATEPVGSACLHALRIGAALDDGKGYTLARELREAGWFCERARSTPGLVEEGSRESLLLRALAAVPHAGLAWWRASHEAGTDAWGDGVTLGAVGGHLALAAGSAGPQ